MNTGTQRSSATPKGVRTATTPVHGKQENKKDIIQIMEAHGVGYIATASPSYPGDLYDKVLKARDLKGMRYIHIHVPCPPGWAFPTRDTISLGRLAVETGVLALYEIVDGALSFTAKTKTIAKGGGKLRPLEDYLSAQGRFKGMGEEIVAEFQDGVRERWERFAARDRQSAGA